MEKSVKDCLPWVGPHAGAREEHKEEGVAEAMCDELAAIPIPYSPVLLWGVEVKKGVKLSLGKR